MRTYTKQYSFSGSWFYTSGECHVCVRVGWYVYVCLRKLVDVRRPFVRTTERGVRATLVSDQCQRAGIREDTAASAQWPFIVI